MDSLTCTELKTEPALAKRWLRTGMLPLPVWQWLCGRNVTLCQHLPPAPTLLLQSLQAFAEPIGSHSSSNEKQTLDSCLAGAAQLISLCHQHARGPALACQHRMLAASLLPLYRGLARGSVAEVTSVLRRQLADALTLAAALIEFRDELPELLCHAMADDHSPYKKFTDALQLDLESLTQVMLVAGTKWNSGDANQLDMIVREEIKTDWRPGWGQPAVLWRLAGELIAQRSEFMVPRDWIDVPVPWSQASEHWLDIVHALEQLPNSVDANEKAGITLKVAQVQGSPKTSSDSSDQGLACASDSDSKASSPAASHSPEAIGAKVDNGENGENGENGLTDEAAFIADVAAAKHDATRGESTVAPANSLSIQASTADDDIQRLKLEIEIADAVDSLVQASRHAVGNAVGNRTDGSHSSQTPRARSEEFVIPKIIIAEVRSHNDPAFVSVVRRQLALCRTEERTMSLLAVKVAPDGEEGNMPTLQSLGLASWQQKLVNWMSDHPEIRDPYAFVSNEGELILSLMDIERNTATPILRQGLVAVLAGSPEDDALLSRPPAPARYHAGIGSVASPAASFEPEQLIEATYRCLDAATRHGKASIKSIEVF